MLERCVTIGVLALVAAAVGAAAPGVQDEGAPGNGEIAALRAQADGPQRQFALARLLELATRGRDAERALAATDALPDFDEEGIAGLERVLRSDGPLPARARALERLATGDPARVRPLLAELAARDEPHSLRILALDALARDPDAMPLIESLLSVPDAKVQARALRLAGRARRPRAAERAREILAAAGGAAEPLELAAIDALREDGSAGSMTLLLEVAGRGAGAARDYALRSLLVMDRGAVTLLVLPLLSAKADAHEALLAIELLAGARPEVVPELAEALDDVLEHPEPEVQAAAVRALGMLGGTESRARLERALTSFDPWVAAAAIEACTRLRRGDPDWRERLLRLLHAPKPPMRLAAIRSLGALHDGSVAPALIRLLDDGDWRVREVAAEALGEVRTPPVIEPLIGHLGGERARVKDAIVRALRRTSGMPLGGIENDWRRWWADHGATFVPPPIEEVEAMEARLAGNQARSLTRATFYGIPVESDHLAIVVDVSGSMQEIDGAGVDRAVTGAAAGAGLGRSRLDVAKREVEELIAKLPATAAINLLFFNESVQRWRRGLVEADRRQAQRAVEFVRDRRAQGATNLFDALAGALDDPEVDTVYLLSDGEPTAGRIVDPAALRAEIARRNSARGVRVHAVAVGHESALLRHLAEDSGGTYVQR